ncbi:hypothetical protein HDU87_007675 [Geranomyces variabilis]|uniref:Uncharacterized protein n=1 Tax=Geranomyces variabilis TaxID=109894 RepID=A0AAD5TG38_9FUNG|nr:hypothetical protein HDU87_007675 [Geranomyces variabilis]
MSTSSQTSYERGTAQPFDDQIAINIEYEIKIDYLLLRSADNVADLKYRSLARKGQFRRQKVTQLTIGKAKSRAARTCSPDNLDTVFNKWLDGDIQKREIFYDAMSELKRFSQYPTALNGTQIDVGSA